MVEGACRIDDYVGRDASVIAVAPSTALLRRAVPLPRFAGKDEEQISPP
jgi:hypothetical protein